MKILDEKNNHIKTVPKKFECVPDILSHLTDLTKKRLSTEERFSLELACFHILLTDRHVKELIEGLKFVKSTLVTPRDGEPYFTATFGTYAVKCGRSMFESSPEKDAKNVNV